MKIFPIIPIWIMIIICILLILKYDYKDLVTINVLKIINELLSNENIKGKNIDLFNSKDDFYQDICFHSGIGPIRNRLFVFRFLNIPH